MPSFTVVANQRVLVVMKMPPRDDKRNRTILETVPVDNSNGWWTGLVRDRDDRTGERRLRLERWVENESPTNPHTWRVRPEFWNGEREAVAQMKESGGRRPPGDLPIDQRLKPLGYSCVRKNDDRWVAVVRLERPTRGECVRLYHWNPENGAVRQKWTVGRQWSMLTDLASRHVRQTV